MLTGWHYLVLGGLGALHGVNPAMGWPIALAAGIRERTRSALLRTLLPIAAGHGLSVFAAAFLVCLLRSVVATQAVGVIGGAALVAFGLWHSVTRRHHPSGFQPSHGQLAAWSFLMSCMHGAGLALLPLLVTTPVDATHHVHTGLPAGADASLWVGATATAVHTLAMVAAAGAVALVAFQLTGVSVLRVHSWFHLDRVWAFALAVSGVSAVAFGLAH